VNVRQERSLVGALHAEREQDHRMEVAKVYGHIATWKAFSAAMNDEDAALLFESTPISIWPRFPRFRELAK